MKHLVLSAVIAVAVTVFAPRDLQEASDLLLKAGALVIRFGMSLHDWQPRRGYDLDPADDDDSPEQEHARLRAGVALSGHS